MKFKKLSHVITFVTAFISTEVLALTGIPGIVVPDPGATIGYEHLQYPSWGQRTHFGVDIWADEGKGIHAMAGGIIEDIISTGDRNFNSLGNAVIIRHPNIGENGEDLYSLYLHMNNTPLVGLAETVYSGQIIGYIGTTGSANGIPHTHFEIRNFSERLSPTYNNIYANGDVRRTSYAQRAWENPAILPSDWKWHGNGSIISHSSQGSIDENCWGCTKDELRIHPELSPGFRPEGQFQWQASSRCRSLRISDANGHNLDATIYLKPWNYSQEQCTSPQCLERRITLPYTVPSTYAPSNSGYSLINLQFNLDPDQSHRIIAECR